MANSRDEIWDEWGDRVNMAPKELEDWLDTEESKSVGDSADGESTGHESGRRIVKIKRTKKDELSGDQWDWMNKTVGYINRHCAQKPDGDVADTTWRYSLMNWGHDPLKNVASPIKSKLKSGFPLPFEKPELDYESTFPIGGSFPLVSPHKP